MPVSKTKNGRIPEAWKFLSPSMFLPGNCRTLIFVEKVSQTLQKTGLEPEFSQLEITESTVMTDVDQCRLKFNQLCSLGVRIVIDDFGSGYSSLARLASPPIHAIKLIVFFCRILSMTNVMRRSLWLLLLSLIPCK